MSRTIMVIGALLVLTGTGAFALSRDVASLLPAMSGMVFIVGGMVAKRTSVRAGALVMLCLGLAVMILSISSVPRAIRMIGGQPDPAAARTTAVAIQAVLSLVAVTGGIRAYFRAASTE